MSVTRRTRAYFNYAGLARPSDRVARRVLETGRKYAGLLFSNDGVRMYEQTLRESRAAAAALLGVGTDAAADGVSLLPNSSTALNLAISILGATLKPGDLVITSDQEHPCVDWPLGRLEARGIELVRIAASSDTEFVERVGALTAKRHPRLAVFCHVSYKNGRVLPVREMGRILAEHEVPYVVDGAQALGQVAVDVRETKAWAYAFSGHKWLFGPMGTGGLWTSERFLRHNQLAWSGPTEAFGRRGGGAALESGTLNCALIAGLGEACRACGEEFASRVEALSRRRGQISQSLKGLYPNAADGWDGPSAPGIVAYLMPPEVRSADLAEAALRRYGVAVKPFGPAEKPDAIRISCSPWTTEGEIELLAEAMRALANRSPGHIRDRGSERAG